MKPMFPASVFMIWGFTTAAKIIATIIVAKARRQYPFFFLYLLWSSAIALMLWVAALRHDYFLYFYANYDGLMISDALLLGVLLNLGKLLFWPLWILPKDVIIFVTFGLVAIATGITIHTITDASHHPDALVAAARTAGRASNVALISILATFFLVSSLLHIPWRKRAFGIATGLGANLACSALTSMLTISASPVLTNAVQWIHLSGYLVATLFWVISFRRPDTELLTLEERDFARLIIIIKAMNNWRKYCAETPKC